MRPGASRKARILLGSSALAAAVALSSAPAHAQEYGVHHTEHDLLELENPEGTLIEGAQIGVFAADGALELRNLGAIRGNGTSDDFSAPPGAGVTIAEGPSSVVNSGTISGAGFGITTAYFYNPATGLLEGRAIGTTVANSGSIIGDSNDGVRLIGGGTITNSGLIAGRGGAFADGISMYAFNDQDTTGQTSIGTVTNQAGGTIEGNRFGVILTGGGVLQNAGTITGPALSAGGLRGLGAAVVIQSAVNNGKTGIVTNSGVMTGGVGVQFAGGISGSELSNSGAIEGVAGSGVLNVAPGALTLTNDLGGTITGATSGIYAEVGALVLNNAGTIRGNGSYDGFERIIDAGVGIAQAGSSVINSGNISGANAGITTAYFYNPATGLLEGRAIGTSVANSGSIVGESNDGVRLIGGGTVTNSGLIAGRSGTFADGISMFAFNGQDTTDQTSIGTVTNLTGGIIEGNRFGVILSGGGVVQNAGTITGPALNAGALRGLGAAVVIQSSSNDGKTGIVTNSGTMIGGGGVQFAGGLSAAELSNSGNIEGVAGSGVLNVTPGALTLTNDLGGTITGATSGIYAEFGALVLNNAGTIRGNGIPPPGPAGQAGVRADGGVVIAQPGSSVTNSGVISGAANGVSTTEFFGKDEAGNPLDPQPLTSDTTIVNTQTGSIVGEAGMGVALIGGGSVINDGYIRGSGKTNSIGVIIAGYPNRIDEGVTGIGTVTNASTGTIEGGVFGVLLSGGGTIDNAGTIRSLNQQAAPGSSPFGVILSATAGQTDRVATVNNSGTISGLLGMLTQGPLTQAILNNSGTVGGQAVGIFANTSVGTTTINNLAGGSITGGAYAIRANTGKIEINNATGARITSNTNAIEIVSPGAAIDNAGLIEGGNYGIDSLAQSGLPQPAATSINNTGTLIGRNNDGIRLVGGGTVTNSGLIAGRSGTFADGISMFVSNGQDTTGQTSIGTVTNQAGGTIEGNRFGVILFGGGVVDNAGTLEGGVKGLVIGNQDAAGRTADVTNAGTINGGVYLDVDTAIVNNSGLIASATGVAFQSLGAVQLTNSGTIKGTGEYAIILSSFDDHLTLGTGSIVEGAVDGGLGFDVATLGGTSDTSQSVGRLDNFERISIDGGNWVLGSIGGDASLEKSGEGTLTLSGESTYTGDTLVSGGTLVVNGSIISDVFVDSGATLGGTGTTGTVTVAKGGTFAPGNSIGTITVAGDLSFASGSTFAVEANAQGGADRINALGSVSIASGSAVKVFAANGVYRPSTKYTILTAARGVDGKFSSVTTDLAFLDPKLVQSNYRVDLLLIRNDQGFSSIARNKNEASAAAAVEALGTKNALFESVIGQSADGARSAFSSLSGSIYGTVSNHLISDGANLRSTLGNASTGAQQGLSLWGDGPSAWRLNGQTTVEAGVPAAQSGITFRDRNISGSLVSGHLPKSPVQASQGESVAFATSFFGANLVYSIGGLNAQIGGGFGWHDVEVGRTIMYPGLREGAGARFDAQTRQFFGEMSYSAAAGPARLSPYAALSHVAFSSEGFHEVGGLAALEVLDQDRQLARATFGVRAATEFDWSPSLRVKARADVAWQRSWGDLVGAALGRFSGAESAFAISSDPLGRSGMRLDAALDIEAGAFRISATYRRNLAEESWDNGANLSMTMRF